METRTRAPRARAGRRLTRRRAAWEGVGAGGAVWSLAACGQQPGAGGAVPTGAAGPVAIEVLTRPGVTSPTGHSQWYDRTTKERFTPRTEITVNLVDGSPTVAEKHVVLASAGTPPDAAWFGVIADGFGGPPAAKRGLFRPLDELIRRDRFDRGAYWKSALDMFTADGRLFALPTHGHFGANVLYVNLELTKRAGISVPLATGDWTTDQLIEWARKVTRPAEGEWGWWPITEMAEWTVHFLRVFGGEFLAADGKRCVIDSAQARAGLQWVQDAQYKFQTVESLLTPGGTFAAINLPTGFPSGKLAFVASTPGGVANWKAPGQQQIKFELGITLFPKGPGGRRGSQVSASGMGVTGTAKMDAAWRWVQFITDRDNGVLQVTGGAGSPGARRDVWEDPRLLSWDPVYALMQKTFGQPATLHYPANFTFPEVRKVAEDGLAPLWANAASVGDATAAIVREADAILQRPAG
jgi:ABC-type glycerol-3-phosphate transport system substrate-binding protein